MRQAPKLSLGGEDDGEGDEYDSLEREGIPTHSHGHFANNEKSTLQVGTVALLVFFTVSGGPMGSEDAVRF